MAYHCRPPVFRKGGQCPPSLSPGAPRLSSPKSAPMSALLRCQPLSSSAPSATPRCIASVNLPSARDVSRTGFGLIAAAFRTALGRGLDGFWTARGRAFFCSMPQPALPNHRLHAPLHPAPPPSPPAKVSFPARCAPLTLNSRSAAPNKPKQTHGETAPALAPHRKPRSAPTQKVRKQTHRSRSAPTSPAFLQRSAFDAVRPLNVRRSFTQFAICNRQLAIGNRLP